MAQWGVALATGPYVNMDLDPTLDMKVSCAAARSGLQIASPTEKPRLEAGAAWVERESQSAWNGADLKLNLADL